MIFSMKNQFNIENYKITINISIKALLSKINKLIQ